MLMLLRKACIARLLAEVDEGVEDREDGRDRAGAANEPREEAGLASGGESKRRSAGRMRHRPRADIAVPCRAHAALR